MSTTTAPISTRQVSELKNPFVSILLPIRNESVYIKRTLESIVRQDYPSHRVEIIVIDGCSTDDTRTIVERFAAEHANVQLLDNPQRIVPIALNLALAQAHGEVIIWIDGHCEIASNYVSRCVEHLAQGEVDCVGGPIETIGATYRARAIAAAMSCSFGVGGSSFRTVKNRTMLVDTVAFPAYTRAAIERVGAFDEELVRNQDEEYNYRLRKMGGKILLVSEIQSVYYGRSTFKSLWRQYFQYGMWKVRVMQKHPRQMQRRHFVPPLFVATLIVTALAALVTPAGRIALVSVLVAYLSANLLASFAVAARVGWRYLPALPLVFAILHVSYGLGVLAGLFRFWKRWREPSPNVRLEMRSVA
jgi:succinoglycan biosynthesis protein ExoA